SGNGKVRQPFHTYFLRMTRSCQNRLVAETYIEFLPQVMSHNIINLRYNTFYGRNKYLICILHIKSVHRIRKINGRSGQYDNITGAHQLVDIRSYFQFINVKANRREVGGIMASQLNSSLYKLVTYTPVHHITVLHQHLHYCSGKTAA